MVIYLPCRLGEKFTELKFKNWANGKRIYEPGQRMTLTGLTKGLFYPDVKTGDGKILGYDRTGEFPQEYEPKYKISVDLGKTGKLRDMGFPANRTAKLYGICVKDGALMAEFVTTDRYEHLLYPIKDNIKYAQLDENVQKTNIQYCKVNQMEGQLSIFDIYGQRE